MTTIDQFQSAIPVAVGDGQILQRWLLHYLFPGNYPLEDCRLLLHDLSVPESYKTVAARGYAAAVGVDFAFTQAMQGLTAIKAPMGLTDNESALLGLALGLRQYPVPKHLAWWQEQLYFLSGTPAGKQLERFLESVRDPDRHPFPVEALPKPQTADPLVLAGHQDRPNAEHVLALASGILRPIPTWDKTQIAAFLIIQRKRPFPYGDAFLRNMLTVKVEDFALQQLVLSPAERAADKAQHLAEIQQALTAWVDRRAYRMAAITSMLIVLICSTITTLLFVTWPHASQFRDLWDTLKWATCWIGGPIPLLTILVRGVMIYRLGRPWNWDFSLMQQKLSHRLIHRWQRRLRLPFTT